VHRGPGHASGTLVDALIARGTKLALAAGDERPGIVHRLDMETSGVLLIAKTDIAYHSLSDQFMRRSVQKSYITLLRGRLKTAEGTIEAPIARDPDHRQRMAIVSGGRGAETSFTVLAYLDGHTLVEARPRTGRSHQIRVHFASLGHPVAGDGAYSRDRHGGTHRLFLHAARLEFEQPTTGERMVIVSPLAADLEGALRHLAGDDYERVARMLDQSHLTRK
ncbi:MAG: RluA family pseudouridine synthase, partial [Chloroflexi bacterium]|nr:RluA family pseudouridine synthase [Chloroflexota bacterium]